MFLFSQVIGNKSTNAVASRCRLIIAICNLLSFQLSLNVITDILQKIKANDEFICVCTREIRRQSHTLYNKFYSRFPEKKYFIPPRASIRVFVNFLSNSRSSSFSSLIFVRERQLPCISLQRTIFISSVWRATEVILPSSPTLIEFYCMEEIYERFTELLEPSDRRNRFDARR